MTMRRRLRSERGANTIEFALYTPLMFLVVFVIVQFALVWHANQIATATAREAARVARTSHQEGTAESRAYEFLGVVGRGNLRNANIDVVVNGDTYTATVSGRAHEIVPGLTPLVTQVIEGPIEQFTPDL
jgi:Flp pilus assembly protein TadG